MTTLPTGFVTFLFSDIEGSATLWQAHPDAMSAALARHHAILRDAIESHHGHVFQVIGDAFCAAFAAAPDAVAAALAAQRGLHRMKDEGGRMNEVADARPSSFIPHPSSLEIRVRVGLHSGEAVWREGQYEGYLTLTRVQRIMVAGCGGQVLLSQATVDAVGGTTAPLQLRDMGVHRLKGLDTPEHIYQLLADDLPSDFPPVKTLGLANATPLYQTPFIGREVELRQLHAAFDQALAGHGSLLMLVGEPGIGKTALCEQLATYAGLRGGRVLVGHCYESGAGASRPYIAFVETLRAYLSTRDATTLARELGAGAAYLARIVPEMAGHNGSADTLSPPTLDPEDERYRLYEAVTACLRQITRAQTLLLVLEDLHWADRGTLDLLLHITRDMNTQAATKGTRWLIVGTYRDVEVGRAHPLSAALAELRRSHGFHRVLVRGLGNDEVQRMVSRVAAQDVPTALAEAVHRQTEGNPLFVQEVARYIVEAGLVTRDATTGRWRATGTTPLALQIPEGLRDVIGKRISRLSPACNRLLAVAAVIGREFDLETLQVVANSAEDALLDALEEAVRAAVLQEQARGGAGVSYRFAHAFFRQLLYEEMIAPRRLRFHQQVARALEKQHATRLATHAAELAEHFAQSTDAGDLAKAVAYSETAAQRALAVYAYSEAARLLEHALQVQDALDPDDRAKRCDLLLVLGKMVGAMGEPKRAADEMASEAFALAEKMGDTERAVRACQLATEGLGRYGSGAILSTPQYRQWAERYDRYAAPGTVTRVYANLTLFGLSGQPFWCGEWWDTLVQNLELARQLDDTRVLFYVVSWMLTVLYGVAHQPMRFRLLEEFAQRSHEGVNIHSRGSLLWTYGKTYFQFGDRTRAEAAWRELAELSTRTRDASVILWSLYTECQLALLNGELETAVALSERLMARANEFGSSTWGRWMAPFIACRALLYLGRTAEALEWSVGARPDTRILILTSTGHRAEAQDALKERFKQLDVRLERIQQEHDEIHIGSLGTFLEIVLLLEDHGWVAAFASCLSNVAYQLDVVNNCNSIARLLGAAAAFMGDKQQAMVYYQQALEVAGKVRFRPEVALTRLQMAELMAGDPKGFGNPSGLREHLDFAITEFRAMKMQPALEHALKLRETMGMQS
ncbi:MAG: AAA family ATPase [Chloroflexota bacterium]